MDPLRLVTYDFVIFEEGGLQSEAVAILVRSLPSIHKELGWKRQYSSQVRSLDRRTQKLRQMGLVLFDRSTTLSWRAHATPSDLGPLLRMAEGFLFILFLRGTGYWLDQPVRPGAYLCLRTGGELKLMGGPVLID